MHPLPADFGLHPRTSPVTAPWEPLYSRKRVDGIDLMFEVREAHCNSRGFLHGGVIAALCDNSMGISLGVGINATANIVTIGLAVDYVDSAKVGDRVLIEPRVIRAGSSIGFCDVIVKCDDKIIARGNATFSVRIVA